MHNVANRVASALLQANVVGFSFDDPVTFKSGIQSPVYIDNRKLIFAPEQWRIVIVAMQYVLEAQGCDYRIIAGIEAAGIPHSAVLAYTTKQPSIFVRKESKGHGLRRRVEGGDVTGQRVLLIEDQVTTGGSSLSGVEALRAEGAIVEDCLAITSYGFSESVQAFTDAGVRLHILTTFPVIAEVARDSQLIDQARHDDIIKWLENPVAWNGKQQG